MKIFEKLGGAEKAANMYRAKSITVFTKDRQGIYAQLKAMSQSWR